MNSKGASPENSKRHGDIEAMAFLHARRDTPIIQQSKSHRFHDPTDAEVDRIVADHRVELEALVASCRAEMENLVFE